MPMNSEAGERDGAALKVQGLEALSETQYSADTRAKPRGPTIYRRLVNILGPCFGLLLVITLFSLSPTIRPYFLTGANFKIILTQTVIVATGTLGMTIIIVSGGIDLSVGSVVALTSVVGAVALLKGGSVLTSIILTLIVGGGIGLINGVVIG